MMTTRPHILLVHWHDLGRHLGAYGATEVDSPNLDRLAESGVRFDRAFAVSPLCSPARGALFTGRYPHANGLMGLTHLGWEYHEQERTLPMHLSVAGYRTALIGLQHESSDVRRLGFDVVDECRDENGRVERETVAERSVAWIADAATSDRPFLLTVGFREIHRPYPADQYPPDELDATSVPNWLPDNGATRRDFAAVQSAIRIGDRAVGRVLDALDQAGIRDDTWVIFTTDHGLAMPGAKGTLSDAGTGVALLQRFPTAWGIGPGATDRLFSHVDLVPTILDRLGLPVPDDVQGSSHAPWLEDETVTRSEPVFTEKNFHDAYDPIRAVRTDRFKLIRNWEQRPRWVISGDIESSLSRAGVGDDHLEHRAPVELYDLETDPLETRNLAAEPAHAVRRAQLEAVLHGWQAATGDPLLDGSIARPPDPRFGG